MLHLGDRIKLLRKQRGLSQEEVAEAAGIDSKSLSRIESNRFNPALDTLQSLAVALGVEMQDFFAGDPASPKALRAYLFEVISTGSTSELVQISEAVRKILKKRSGGRRL